MTATFARLGILPIWAVSNGHPWAVGRIQKSGSSYDVHGVRDRIREACDAPDLTMGGFRSLGDAQSWCREMLEV